MARYTLCLGVTAVQVAPGALPLNTVTGNNNLPAGSQMADLTFGGAMSASLPPANVAFQVVVSGSGNVSATAQPLGSNDGLNWVNDGNTIAASSSNTASTAGGTSTAAWPYRSAIITAISGTNATAAVLMNA